MGVPLDWVRRRRILVVLCALLLAGPLAVGEAVHLVWWSHRGLGLQLPVFDRFPRAAWA